MTEIVFHVNVPDKLIFSCRLLRKAYLSGARVVVTAEPETLIELDRLLWSFSSTDFVPHGLVAGMDTQDQAFTPILLSATPGACGEQSVLLNLGQHVPAQFEGFERFIEVVAQDHDEVVAGRQRWKHYATRGYALKSHKRANPGAVS